MEKALAALAIIQSLVIYDTDQMISFAKAMCLFLQKQRIYLHVFPSGKLYVGQTDNYETRVKQYKSCWGSNPHIANALRKYKFENVITFKICAPIVLLNTIEIFLISFLNLMNREKGYNKTSGGKARYTLSLESRMKMSVANIGRKVSSETRVKQSVAQMIAQNRPEVKAKQKSSGKIAQNRPEVRLKKSVSAKIAQNRPEIVAKNRAMTTELWKKSEYRAKQSVAQKEAQKRPEVRARKSVRMSRGNNPAAKPVSAFGILFPSSIDASLYWRSRKASPNAKKNFIKEWKNYKKYKDVVFEITKEMYEIHTFIMS